MLTPPLPLPPVFIFPISAMLLGHRLALLPLVWDSGGIFGVVAQGIVFNIIGDKDLTLAEVRERPRQRQRDGLYVMHVLG